MISNIRFWPGLALVLLLVVVPMVVASAYRAWMVRFGSLLGALDGILMILVCCALLFAIGRLLRRLLWREPMTDAQFLMPLVLYATMSFDRVRGNEAPMVAGAFVLLSGLSIWLGARGSRSSVADATGIPRL